MKRGFTRLAFTPAVEETQHRLGARARNRDLETIDTGCDRITPDLAAFIAARDSFFWPRRAATASPISSIAAGRRASSACSMGVASASSISRATGNTSPQSKIGSA